MILFMRRRRGQGGVRGFGIKRECVRVGKACEDRW